MPGRVMLASTCPDQESLRSYLAGHLSRADRDRVEEHWEGCPRCQALLPSLSDAEDTLIVALRQEPTCPAYEQDPAFLEAVAKIERLADHVGLTELAGRQHAAPDAAAADRGPSSARSMPALDRVREYVLLEKLGEGGMGAVYRAQHTKLKRTVAIKLLSAERVCDPAAVARFEREMEAIGAFDHPSIVRAHDAGESDGRHFLVMEYVSGTDLSRGVLAPCLCRRRAN